MVNILKKECIRIGSKAVSKSEIISEIAELAKKSSILSDISADEIKKNLMEREKLSSTGLAKGIAIPHCSFDSINEFVVGLIVVSEGIDFNSIDGAKSRFFFFIIGPKDRRNQHIKILSSISLLSKDLKRLDTLAKQASTQGIFDVLETEDDTKDLHDQKHEKCQLTLYIQEEELFDGVLEILSSDVEGSLIVLETVNAGYYLNKLPLFSSFWSDSDRTYSKVIMSVIDKPLMNDTIRRINMLRGNSNSGLLLTVQDLIFTEGSIDF